MLILALVRGPGTGRFNGGMIQQPSLVKLGITQGLVMVEPLTVFGSRVSTMMKKHGTHMCCHCDAS